MKHGSVRQSVYKKEIPFELRMGLIILKVTIHGKEYNFLFDTGAPNLISKELAQEQGLIAKAKSKAADSQGNRSDLGFVALDSIGIGGLQFLNTGAAIADLQQSTELGCFKLDGFIGANLMRKAVWYIDFERQVMTITNDRHSLAIPSHAETLKFRTRLSGTPIIDVRMNGQTDHSVEIDLGSNGDFDSSEETFRLLQKQGLRAGLHRYGYGSSGLYGTGKQDTTRYAVISSIQMDSLKLSNQVVAFQSRGAKLIGTGFFKHYNLIFDWSSKELIMIPLSTYDNTGKETFPFSLFLQGQQLMVGSVYSSAMAVDGPRLGDQVLEIDGKDYRSCTTESYCALRGGPFHNQPSEHSLLIKRGDQEISFRVSKEFLFLKK